MLIPVSPQFRFARWRYFYFLLAALPIGCGGSGGPERVAVRGEVLLDNQSLKSGRILFVPQAPTEGPAAAGVIVNGAFEISANQGPVVGSNRVEIEGELDLGFPLDDDVAFAKRGRKPLPPNPVPTKYNKTSTLTAAVETEGQNEFSFLLVSEEASP